MNRPPPPQACSHLPLCGWLNVRVAGLADYVIHMLQGPLGDPREDGGTVIAEVAVHLPRAAKVGGALDQHGSRPESLRRGMVPHFWYLENTKNTVFQGVDFPLAYKLVPTMNHITMSDGVFCIKFKKML